jgi:glycogen(starch) synthase
MNIVFVTREYPPSKRLGGIGHYVYDMANKLADMGNNVSVICASDDVDSESDLVHNSVRVIRISGGDFFISKDGLVGKFLNLYREIFKYSSYRKKLAERLFEFCIENKIDLVEFPEYGGEFLFVNEKISPSIVIRLHGPSLLIRTKSKNFLKNIKNNLFLGRKKNEISSLGKFKAVTSPSKALSNWVNDRYNTDIINIQNSIDCVTWMEDGLNSANPFDENNLINIFSAGTVDEGKGVPELIETVRILRLRGLNIKLTIAGRLSQYGKTLAEKCSSGDSQYSFLVLLGAIDRKKLAGYYHHADAVIFLSRWEPFGLVCVEAMAAGGLVIASNRGGMAEIINDAENGYLIEPENPNKVANLLEFILKKNNQNIRKNAINKAINNFDLSAVAKNTIDLYRNLI